MQEVESTGTERIAVVIPCFNEALGIGRVVEAFREELPGATIIVVDNGSTDSTAVVAKSAGGLVLRESRRGKGYALSRGFLEADSADWVVMVDGDGTYPAKDVHNLLKAAREGSDMVVATRTQAHEATAFPRGHTVGNWMFATIVRLLFRARVTDLLSGYRILSRRFLDEVPLVAQGFEIETELSLQALVGNFPVSEVPVRYGSRVVGSASKLRTYRDGTRILIAILAFIRDYHPLTFFGILAAALFTGSIAGGSVVLAEYFRTGQVLRLPLAVLSSASFLLGSLFAVTGIVLSSLNRHSLALSILSRRTRRQLRHTL